MVHVDDDEEQLYQHLKWPVLIQALFQYMYMYIKKYSSTS